MQLKFAIFADCAAEAEPEGCEFSIDRGSGRIPLRRDGDLTVVGGRLVPTYLNGRRFFREMCPGWDRFLDIEHNGRYVDRPSLTP